jgi:alpha-1,2-mannosyltransferase
MLAGAGNRSLTATGTQRSWPRAAVLLSIGVVILAVICTVSEPAILFSDFYKAYFRAAEQLWREGPGPTWSLGEPSVVGFVNLPIVAWLFVPLVPLGEEGAAWAFLALGVAATATAWALLTRMAKSGVKIGAVLLFFFLVNGPLINGLREGNTTPFILLLLVLALLLWSAGEEYMAGLLLGVCAVIKPPLLLYGVYFVLRGRWRVVTGGASVIALAAVLSLLVFGLDVNLGWYQNCIEPFLGRVIPGYNVQSVDGFLMRLTTGSHDLRDWSPAEPTAAHAVIRKFLFAGVFGGAFWLLWRGRSGAGGNHRFNARDVLEYVFILIIALVMSPVSWTHYYLLLLLPWGLYLGGQLALPDDAATRGLMGTGIVLSSLPVIVLATGSGWIDSIASRTVVSAWLFGGLCMLAALARGLLWLKRSALSAKVVAWPRPWQPALAVLEIRDAWAHASFTLPRKMLIFLALNAVLLSGILWAASPPGYKDTVLRQASDFLHAKSGGDSWGVMSTAYDYLRWPHQTPIYSEMFFDRGVKIQYPPPALFVIPAMRLGGYERLRLAEAYYGPWPSTNDVVGWAFILTMIGAIAALLHIHLRRVNALPDGAASIALTIALAAGFTLTFYPVMKAYTLGQIQVWLNSLFALSLLCFTTGRKVLSGVLLGFVCLVKPHFGLFLAWALVRREWRFIVAFAAIVCVGLAASLATFSFADHLDYLRMLSHMAERGEAYFPNQSINGLLNRLMGIADPEHYNNLVFNVAHFPPFNGLVYGATVVTSSIILIAAIAWRDRDHDGVFDFCRMAVSLTVASPIAWEHHYGILLPVYAVMLPAVLHDRRRAAWLIASYVLASNFIPATKLLAATPFNVLQSYLLAGAFIVLALLYRMPQHSVAKQARLSPATNRHADYALEREGQR